ncbi:MAG: hypothetical protein J7K40_14150 [candidate division Zixibacteria bacterium]|nr:hypothetical protein [candidate division Zixibacteria bacterium]
MIKIKPFISLRKSIGVYSRGSSSLLVSLIALMVLLLSTSVFGINMRWGSEGRGPLGKSLVGPNMELRVHRISKVYFSITNYGKLGSESQDLYDPLTSQPAPSCEFPGGSNFEYLFQGCVWIGAIQENPDEPGVYDTLVSIGDDGWQRNINELLPSSPPAGEILMLSTRGEASPPYAPTTGSLTRDIPGRVFEAISEQDFICKYDDTKTSGVNIDPISNRPHKPLGISVIQKSYSWSYEYAEDFILIDFEIENVGQKRLNELWLGLYIDADVLHTSENGYGIEEGAQDDLCGFIESYANPQSPDRSSDIYTAWIADNDGQPYGGIYDVHRSPRGVSGCRVVNWPGRGTGICEDDYQENISYSFNWWISNMDNQYDWGPQLQEKYDIWGDFPDGAKGTPGGDIAKYQVMSNTEFDYDQAFCDLDSIYTGNTWIPKSDQAQTLANGYDTRYLFSFGGSDAFKLMPGDICTLTVAYICGENLHNDPSNYANNLRDGTNNPASVQAFYDNLNFSDFATNAQWASWVYDNPGVDTDGDGCSGRADTLPSGDVFWYMGDGVPDFTGPPPPTSPKINFEVDKGYIKLSWCGINIDEPGTGPEDCEDLFSGLQDFEGYAIYISYDALDWTLLRRYDKVDWLPVTWDASTPEGWAINLARQNPITTDSLMSLGGDTVFVHPDERDTDGEPYWTAYDFNSGFDEILDSTNTLVIDSDTVLANYYSFTVDDLLQTKGIYLAVTAFDFGNAQTDLSSLESAKTINSALIYPIKKDADKKIMVYPNPYKKSNTSIYQQFEEESPVTWAEQDRRIFFSGFTDDQRAIVRIWSLDGDLIMAITYDPDNPQYYGTPPGIIYWNLVSRNGQAVVSGLYLYSIEFIAVDGGTNRESEIGKFAIIK